MKSKLLILCPALLTIIILLVAQSDEQISKTLERKYTAFGLDLDINKALDGFKQVLLDKKVLSEKEMNDPSVIYAELSKLEPSVNPLDFGIQKFITKRPLTETLESVDILSLNTQTQAEIALFTYYQLFSAKHCEFTLYLQDKRLVEFDGEYLPINRFEAVLFEAIAARKELNVSVKNTKMIIKGDPYTPTEFVNFITSKLREMKLRSVTFEMK